jgi:3-oxoacyl-[acyl-carrier-protein] synthase II
MVLLEPEDDAGGTRLLAVETAMTSQPAEVAETLAACIVRALRRARVGPDDVWAVAPSGCAPGAAGPERSALELVLADMEPQWVDVPALIGDTHAASGLFQLLAVLALADAHPVPEGRVALLTSVDRDGQVGCAVVASS